MVYYERISVSEGIHVNETSVLKEYFICHFLYCLRFFKFQ